MKRFIDSNLLTGKENDLESLSNLQRINLQDNLNSKLGTKFLGCKLILDVNVYPHLSKRKHITGERIGGLMLHKCGAVVDIIDCSTFKELRVYLNNLKSIKGRITYIDFLVSKKVRFSNTIGIHDIVIKSNSISLNMRSVCQPRFINYNQKITALVNNFDTIYPLLGLKSVDSIGLDVEGLFSTKIGMDTFIQLKSKRVFNINITQKRLANETEIQKLKLKIDQYRRSKSARKGNY